MRYKIRALLLAITALTLMARMTLPVLAQNPVGAIRGIVTDQQGAVIQNANITVTNKATGDVRKASTGDDGVRSWIVWRDVPLIEPELHIMEKTNGLLNGGVVDPKARLSLCS